MSAQICTIYLVLLTTSLVLVAGNDTTAKPETETSPQNTEMTSNGSTPLPQVNATTSSDTGTAVFLEPKNCTRTKMITTTVREEFIGKCVYKTETCSGIFWWRKCKQKDVYKPCTKNRTKTKTMYTTEAICCKGLVPYNDTAAFCVKGCEPGKYGDSCTLDCNCTGNTRPVCGIVTGDCRCTDGWTGQNCTDVCAEGFYGHNCENACACENNSTCDHVNGTCNCTAPGWTGDTCDTVCSEGLYGYYCNQSCSCTANATCDPHSGECQCIAGLTGVNCTKVCDAGYFGADCQQACTCRPNSTRACDPVNGTCVCEAGWRGRNCAEYCSPGTFGESCQEACNCTVTEACHPINGECVSRCLCSVNGTSNCEPAFGIRDCMDIQRNTSLELLQRNMRDILNNPKDICDTINNQTQFCVPSNGTVLCECLAGWTGHSCEQSCTEGYYGTNCKHACTCSTNHTVDCKKETGTCECGSGWTGLNCTDVCSRGMYGVGCGHACTCDDGWDCDRVDGRCLGTGKMKGEKTYQGTPNMTLALGIGIPGFVIVICLVVVCVVYKRKGAQAFSNLKVTVKKTRSTSQRSFADNQTYELQQDIIGSTNRRPLMSEDRSNTHGDSYDEFARNRNSDNRKKGGNPSTDNYTRVVKNEDGSYDNFKNMGRSDTDGDMYTGQIIDGVYNELDHRNGQHDNGVSPDNDEYSPVSIAASTDTYDVMKGRIDTTSGDNVYESSRELSNTYDVFRKKGDTNVIPDSMYDTNDSIAAESQKNTQTYSLPD